MTELTKKIELLEQRQGELDSELEMQAKKLEKLDEKVGELRNIVAGVSEEIKKVADMLKHSQ